MKASGSPFRVKIDEKKYHPTYYFGNMYDAMMLFKPSSIKDYKVSHQFSCKIQVLTFSNLFPLFFFNYTIDAALFEARLKTAVA